MEHIEIEFKILINESTYHQIIDDYKDKITNQYIQINHYLMHPILNEKMYTLRMREKNNTYELTLKRPYLVGRRELNIPIDKETMDMILNGENVQNEISDILKELHLSFKDLDSSHYLQTKRTDILLPTGLLSIDANEYNHLHDYEIEFEVEDENIGKKAFLDLIKPYGLIYTTNCAGKIKRMNDSL